MRRISFIHFTTAILVIFFFSLSFPSIALSQCPQELLPTDPSPTEGFYQCICDFNVSCHTPWPQSGLNENYNDCYQFYNKCSPGYVPGFDKPIDRDDEDFSYFPEYCEGCPNYDLGNTCTIQCHQNHGCITQEQYDYCQCLYDHYDDCEEPGDVPTQPPTPTVTPYEVQGTFGCEWSTDQNRCVLEINDTCGYEHGYLACPERCEEITTQPECDPASFNCETYNQCYDLIPPGCIEARCELNEYGDVINNCQVENPGCVEVADPDSDTNCRCAVRGYENDETIICCTLGAGFPNSEQLIFCDESGNPTDEPGDNPRIYSAIGCIPVESTQEFVGFLLSWGISIAGGIAFILIVYAGLMIITSAGNPQRLQAGKELITAALSGLMLILIGVFILEFIGVDILNIPGFGGT